LGESWQAMEVFEQNATTIAHYNDDQEWLSGNYELYAEWVKVYILAMSKN
jgi:hypothetical protein